MGLCMRCSPQTQPCSSFANRRKNLNYPPAVPDSVCLEVQITTLNLSCRKMHYLQLLMITS